MIGTSPATMTRFSHKLDYENFQDLKFNIQQEMTETVIENSPIIQRIHKYHQQIIQQTGEFIDSSHYPKPLSTNSNQVDIYSLLD